MCYVDDMSNKTSSACPKKLTGHATAQHATYQTAVKKECCVSKTKPA